MRRGLHEMKRAFTRRYTVPTNSEHITSDLSSAATGCSSSRQRSATPPDLYEAKELNIYTERFYILCKLVLCLLKQMLIKVFVSVGCMLFPEYGFPEDSMFSLTECHIKNARGCMLLKNVLCIIIRYMNIRI